MAASDAEKRSRASRIIVIFALAPTGRSSATPAAVGAYIGAAYFFTSSSSFANPAISIGRIFSNTFAGIAPASVPAVVIAQTIGGVLAIRALYRDITPAEAASVMLPHSDTDLATIDHLAGRAGERAPR